MLKKTNARPAGASSGNRNSGVMRLFKVLAVQDDGLVISYADSQDQGTYFMQATPSFVEQKNKAANFMAKSPGKEMHKKFYHALMRPTTNAEHQFRKGQDILSAKVYSSNGTKTVEGYGVRLHREANHMRPMKKMITGMARRSSARRMG